MFILCAEQAPRLVKGWDRAWPTRVKRTGPQGSHSELLETLSKDRGPKPPRNRRQADPEEAGIFSGGTRSSLGWEGFVSTQEKEANFLQIYL